MGNTTSNAQSLWTRLHAPRHARVIMIGVDGVGKTTILYHIAPPQRKNGPQIEVRIPSLGFNHEVIELPRLTFTTIDVGGPCSIPLAPKIKKLVRENADGVVYVLDARAEDGRWQETIEELELFVLGIEETAESPLLILANFADSEIAMPMGQINQHIQESLAKHDRLQQRLSIRAINAKTGAGVWEGLDWLVDQLNITMNARTDMQQMTTQR